MQNTVIIIQGISVAQGKCDFPASFNTLYLLGSDILLTHLTANSFPFAYARVKRAIKTYTAKAFRKDCPCSFFVYLST